jgi:UDP-N-acetylglucosamine 1-carboxyvinyltransferase
MVKIRIKGGAKLNGEILISGGKNASMPIIIASTLISKPIILENIPFVSDVTTLLSLLTSIGTEITMIGDAKMPKTLKLETKKMEFTGEAGLEASKIRTSILLVGPALARNGYVKILKPGGCNIGERKIDYHILGMKALGAEVLETENYLELTTNGKKLKGATIKMPSVSVGATQNLIMAATLAEGKTIIQMAAVEPEIEDLINFLNSHGAQIEITGEREITIIGVLALKGGNYTIMPDRIEALTYAMMACATKGKVLLKNISIKYLKGGIETLTKIGMEFEDKPSSYFFGSVECRLKTGEIHPITLQTSAFPGFATDLQPQLSVLMLLADGVSEITENIFENRFKHIEHLQKMGAKIEFLQSNKIRIEPSPNLCGGDVQGTDLRACAALLMAGMISMGETILSNAESIDRGYYNFTRKLNSCGIVCNRID